MKRLVFTFSLILAGAALFAQPGQPDQRDERLKAYRIAIFTQVLSLTPEEATGFWPVYNEYQEKRDKAQEELKPTKKIEDMTDQEVEDQIKRHFEMRQRDLDLEKELYQKLRGVLPLRKIAKIPVAEREFREQLINKLREIRAKRQAQQPPRRGPGRN